MKPLIKYTGGKSRELPYIYKYLPDEIIDSDINKRSNYYEPFVGGGAVYFSLLNHDYFQHYYLNDKSLNLIQFYKWMQHNDTRRMFITEINSVEKYWKLLDSNDLSDVMQIASDFINSKKEKNARETNFANALTETKISNIFALNQIDKNSLYLTEFKNSLKWIKKIFTSLLKRKLNLIRKHNYTLSDFNIRIAMKEIIYDYARKQCNTDKYVLSLLEQQISYYLVKELAYSGMSRFNKQGKLNMPYGGGSYNKKNLASINNLILSSEFDNGMQNTIFSCHDFADFMNSHKLTEHDFIFLDPPYDTKFSNYANNTFDENDQKRLADYLKLIPAKWMLIVKNTPLIANLYLNSDKRYRIIRYKKKYNVSFKNRQQGNTHVEHLLIMNY